MVVRSLELSLNVSKIRLRIVPLKSNSNFLNNLLLMEFISCLSPMTIKYFGCYKCEILLYCGTTTFDLVLLNVFLVYHNMF